MGMGVPKYTKTLRKIMCEYIFPEKYSITFIRFWEGYLWERYYDYGKSTRKGLDSSGEDN